MMYEGINNKVVVITGASKGLGKALALNIAKFGGRVVINYYHDKLAAESIEQEIEELGGECFLYRADISNENQVQQMYKNVISKYGKVDVLINNAGINNDDYIHWLSTERWNSVIKTNLEGTFLCSKYFSKNMIHNRNGKIINIASLKGQLGAEGQSNYSASKAAIIALTKSMAKEMGEVNISVNAVCPGYIKTDINRTNRKKYDIAKKMSVLQNEFGLSDFVNFVTFMSSDLIKGVSGQVFNIDSRIL